MRETVIAAREDRSMFSLHEEEDVVEVPLHLQQVTYFETNLRRALPNRFVGANMGVYWVPGQFVHPWVGPDVLVAQRAPRDPEPRVHLVWEDGPLLFVIEVASERTLRAERTKQEQNYQIDLQVPEQLYTDLDRHELALWRRRELRYHQVLEEDGRLFSQVLNLWFGWDPDREFVRLWTPDGRMLPTVEEVWEQGEQAEARARAAEARASEQVQAAEARVQALEAELERLRRLMSAGSRPESSEERDDTPAG
jgi:hypothetical protein